MGLHSSGEMYLETIYILSKKMRNVRALDVSEKMGFSKPSVSRALKKLIADSFIVVDENGYITLSDKGKSVAEKMFERHNILTQLLMELGVDEETATEDACKIEHDISDKSFEAIKKHMQTFK
ncbi:MAG: metal-dependent transcriptional regulator [Clostridia bacterium]|nr:metal-dependent transcriptional regulator [Clostridia bacterium]